MLVQRKAWKNSFHNIYKFAVSLQFMDRNEQIAVCTHYTSLDGLATTPCSVVTLDLTTMWTLEH